MKKIVRVLVIVFILFIVSACSKDKIKVVDKLDFEVNSTLKHSDLVIPSDEVTLLDGSETIDTSELGTFKVVLKYLYNDELKYKSLNVNIVDTKAPTIKFSEKVSTTKGIKINLVKDVKVSDNSKESIKVSVIGDYDINTIGSYPLKYYAVDSSGNSTTKDFTLTVKDISVKTTGYYIYKTKKVWVGMSFKKNNKIEIDYNFCPGSGCGGYSEFGTYSIKNKNITVKITSYADESGKGKTSDSFKCTLSSETKMKCSGTTYNWNSKFN